MNDDGVWFHLSSDPRLTKVVPSKDEEQPNVLSPRVPGQCQGEDQETRRVCVAPTIWQCILSIPLNETRLFIYRINADCVSSPSGGIYDGHVTNEFWITDDDIEKAGGEIQIELIGFVLKNKILRLSLMNQRDDQKLPFNAEGEQEIWEICEGENGLKEYRLVDQMISG